MVLWHLVAAMLEVAQSIIGADRPKRPCRGLKQRLKRPRLGLPKKRLHLGEGFLYGVEVRRVGRKEPQLAAPLFDEIPHPAARVHREVVHEDYLPALEGRGQDLP